jgi:hypothetical protein
MRPVVYVSLCFPEVGCYYGECVCHSSRNWPKRD